MKIWVSGHNGVLQDLKNEFEVVKSVEDADRVVLWNDVQPEARGIINYARALKIPTIVVQHGRKGSSKYYPPFNEKICADKMLVWGDFDRRSLIEAGNDPKKIEVVGTTIFSHLKSRKEHDGINVVFCPEHWDRDVQENKDVVKELRKIKGVTITTKIIEVHNEKDFDNPIVSNRESSDHLDICAEVLSTADVVVGISESTFELLAQALDIPVVIMEEWEPKSFGGDAGYLSYRRIISPAAHRTSLKDLNKTIRYALEHPEALREERRQVAIDEGGHGLDALNELKRAIVQV